MGSRIARTVHALLLAGLIAMGGEAQRATSSGATAMPGMLATMCVCALPPTLQGGGAELGGAAAAAAAERMRGAGGDGRACALTPALPWPGGGAELGDAAAVAIAAAVAMRGAGGDERACALPPALPWPGGVIAQLDIAFYLNRSRGSSESRTR